eukprot:1023597-Heterocapsa_arctica.AAC.1
MGCDAELAAWADGVGASSSGSLTMRMYGVGGPARLAGSESARGGPLGLGRGKVKGEGDEGWGSHVDVRSPK